jgi:AcrR family transcriptional regulator
MSKMKGTDRNAARRLALLWGLQPWSGRKSRADLSIEKIVSGAVDTADEAGLDALSMRRVAERLGVGTMTLYTYIPGKEELIDLMLDSVYGEMTRPANLPEGWRARLEQVARENWLLARRHPWILQVSTIRPPLGPNSIAKYDFELTAVAGIGLSEIEMDSIVDLVNGHVDHVARRWLDATQAERESGMTDEEWWELNGPLIRNIVDDAKFPTAARVGVATGEAYGAAYAPEHAFEFGLQRVLDGIEAFVERRQAELSRKAERL